MGRLRGVARSQFGRASVGLLSAQIATTVGALAFATLTSRALGLEGRGVLSLVLQCGAVLSVVFPLGLERSLAAADPRSTLIPAAHVLVIRYVQVAAAVMAMAILLGVLGHPIPALTLLALCLGLASAAQRIARADQIRLGATSRVVMMMALSQGAGVIASVIMFSAEVDSALPYGVGATIGLIVSLSLWPRLRTIRVGLPDGWRRDLSSSGRLVGGSLSLAIGLRADRLLMPALVGMAELGRYSVAATVSEAFAWPMIVMADAMLPHIDRQDRSTLRKLWLLAVAASFGLAAIASLMLPLLTELLFGDEFKVTRPLAVMLAIGGQILGLSRVAVSRLVARGHHGEATRADIVGMAAGLVAYVALMPTLGEFGAALGSALAYLATSLYAAPRGMRGDADGCESIGE